ncbi:hypothetical protein V2J09_024194 [Rumex salicifolius]
MAEEYNNNRVMGGTKWWDSSTVTAAATASSSLSTLQMMGLGPTSHSIHGHDIMTDAGFRSMYGEPSPSPPIKGFSLDQFSHTSSVDSCSHGGLASPTPLMPIESGPTAASGIFQVFMEPPPLQSSGYGYNNQAAAGYGSSDNLMGPNCNWNTTSSGKILHEAPQFFKASNLQQPHFFNNGHGGSFWNTAANSMDDPRPASFFPVDPPLTVPSFHDKHHHKNNMMAVKSTSTGAGRKSNLGSDRTSTTATASTASTGGGTAKRSRNEASSAMPPFKVRKEKMGDRITALQQLVSPFGKTDTASVLSESIEYIKFLHEQVNVLSTPYLKSGASLQLQQQNHNMLKDPKASKKDLRSRGLCLVPVSSTFPVAHETTVDFWTPAFGSGTFR